MAYLNDNQNGECHADENETKTLYIGSLNHLESLNFNYLNFLIIFRWEQKAL